MYQLDEKIRYHLAKIDYRLGATQSPDDYVPHGFVANWSLIPMFEMAIERAIAGVEDDKRREAVINLVRDTDMHELMESAVYVKVYEMQFRKNLLRGGKEED